MQQALLADLTDPALHRAIRLRAGRELGAMGDPRCQPVRIGTTEVIVPDWVWVPGGTATLGSGDQPSDWQALAAERPQHQVAVRSFWLARGPVTNAEYGCFMAAGGYKVQDYWTPAGWHWRLGQQADSAPVEEILELRRYFLSRPGELDRRLAEGRMLPAVAEAWRAKTRLSAAEVREAVLSAYPAGPHDQPAYWDDPAYNAPNQPVTGVTWHEANAYCRWLQAQGIARGVPGLERSNPTPGSSLGPAPGSVLNEAQPNAASWQVRLPTEAEWEWAAGGPEHTPFPWRTAFDVDKANTLEGRVLGPTPVGAYPAGAAACGAVDLSGNVWEWCHSLFRPYPYDSADGREDPLAPGKRVLRGGSWYNYRRGARVMDRKYDRPVYAPNNFGFRVALVPPLARP